MTCRPLTPLFRLAGGPAALLAGLLAFLIPASAPALGILVPREPRLSPIQLGPTSVRTEIRQNLARTRVVQEFYNPNPRQLEADFFFPVPKGADVTDFVLYMNGKPVQGEVLEKEKARHIYEGIVRRMQDPGLLEWLDYNLFKVRVFPVPPSGSQKIELEFAQPLEADQGTFKYTFPLRAPKEHFRPAERTGGDPAMKMEISIVSDEPVRNVHSPTHSADVDMKDPKSVNVRVEARDLLTGPGDFVLFYEPSQKDMAMSLVATRPDPGADGFFSLMLSPPIQFAPEDVAPQDVTFVIDTSGSMMESNKIEQARRALAYCVGQLRPQDRFALIRFATETEKYQEDLVPATAENLESARRWIGDLKARGGTNIGEALEEALALRPESGAGAGGEKSDGAQETTATVSRIYTVVFITDGLPTVGQTNPDQILQTATRAIAGGKGSGAGTGRDSGLKPERTPSERSSSVRIFTFGVGHDVNTKLLDRLAEETRAAAEYIRPGEDLEVPISRFFDKISRPAMTNLRLEIPGAGAYDLYPKDLPDLFYGTQLTVFGRYRKPGPSAIRLTGMVAGKPAEYTYEKTFPEQESENGFVEKLWGTRKIAYLLDSIRKSGESDEVKEEVIRLAKKYGVVTPYTSYLVTEDTPAVQPPPPAAPIVSNRTRFERRGFDAAASRASRVPGRPASPRAPEALQLEAAPVPSASVSPLAASDFAAETGAGAVAASKRLQELKTADTASAVQGDSGAIRNTSGRTFRLVGGVWTDTEAEGAGEVRLRVKYLSQAYFEVLQLRPELREAFALGERVRVKLAQGILEVGPEGKEELEAADRGFLAAGKNP